MSPLWVISISASLWLLGKCSSSLAWILCSPTIPPLTPPCRTNCSSPKGPQCVTPVPFASPTCVMLLSLWQFVTTYVLSMFACCHFSCVWLFSTRWTVACQAPLSIGFSTQGRWSGLPCPLGDLPNPGTKPSSPTIPALQADAPIYSYFIVNFYQE